MRGTLRKQSATTWQIRIFRGRDDDGRQMFDYHTIEARTTREAEVARTRLLHALDTGGYAEPSRLTVGDYLESWLADYAAHNVSPHSFDRYCDVVRKHLVPAFGDLRLNQLQPVRIQRYYATALDHGRLHPPKPAAEGDPPKPTGLSPGTVLYHHQVLRGALKRAVRLGLLMVNPCDRVDPPRRHTTEMLALDELDTERLITAARTSEPMSLYPAVLLAANTGMRRGEILGLRWSDVDLDGATLQVARSLQQSQSGLAFKEPKTAAGKRRLSLDADTVAELRAYKARQSARRLLLGKEWHDRDLVCAGPNGEPWRPDVFKRAYERMRDRHGFTARFHDLRHSHASQLIRTGAPAKVVQERLGHASAGFTLNVYGHLLPGMQDEAVRMLGVARAEARAKVAAEG